jgi:hypothetical protein
MIPAFVWEYKLILRFIIRVSSHLKEALCVFGGSTIQEFTVAANFSENKGTFQVMKIFTKISPILSIFDQK